MSSSLTDMPLDLSFFISFLAGSWTVPPEGRAPVLSGALIDYCPCLVCLEKRKAESMCVCVCVCWLD